MSLILSGTNGLSDVDGSAATPAIRGTDTNTGIFFPAADTIAFAEGGVEAMRLDSSGNLGLGVTPSAWVNAKAIDIATYGSISTDAATSAGISVAYNAYGISATSWKYKNSYFATRYTQEDGLHKWFNAPSGTAGNAISFTQAMTLDASGVLYVGANQRAMLYQDVSGDAVIGGATGGTLKFFSTGSERARIDSSGNLLVGNTGGTNKLTVSTTTQAAAIRCENSRNVSGDFSLITSLGSNCNNTSSYHIICATGGNDRFYVYGNGNVVNTNNSYGALSDIKLKENITDATPKLAQLNQVRVVTYNLIGEEQKQIGVIAQELEQIFPAMVDETLDLDAEGNDLGTTTKSVKYSVFVPMLIKAIQEQQAIITQLQADVAALKGQA
jgi:hypothetical protein